MRLYEENGRHIGWFDRDTALRVTKNLFSVVYALACSKIKPDNSILPCFFEDSFYFGKSHGASFDKKNRSYPGVVQTNPHGRLKAHNAQLYNPNTEDDKYRLFHDKYQLFENNDPDLRNNNLCIWYSLSIPRVDMSEIEIPVFLDSVEKDYCFLYTKTFKRTPLINLDQKSATEIKKTPGLKSRRVPNTLSYNVMNGSTLSDFLVA